MEVYVLRIGHRYVRDERTSTHLFLVARAFGAHGVIYTGQRDKKIEDEVVKIDEDWGGTLKVEYAESWERIIKKWREGGGEVIHLTMYGLPIQDVIGQIRKSEKDKLIIVGGAKVPGPVYKMAVWNVAVTNQPHSEVSALSVFLHELFEGRELTKNFKDAKMIIMPQPKGKKVIKGS